MTLIIGIRCPDGVVVGADSIRTFPSYIEQEVSNKIQQYNDNVLVGSAGVVGLSQLIKDELSRHWTEIKQQEQMSAARNMISDAMLTEVRRAHQRSKVLDRSYEGCSHIVAFPLQNRPVLLQFNQAAESVEATLESPFVSVGAGRLQADPFLAFIRRTFWNNQAPERISDGVFSVLWTLDHVSRVNAGLGVGGRSRIAVLQMLDGFWHADFLTENELAEHKEAINEAEDSLRSFGIRFNPYLNDGQS